MVSPPRAPSLIDRSIKPLLGGIAATILLVLMLLTCIDVVGRYFLNRPVHGAFELTETMLACLIFAALPLVTLDQGHVTVDVLDGITPRAMLRLQHALAALVGAVAAGYLAWRLWLRGMNMIASGETTAQLKLPLGYLACLMAVLMGVTALASLVVAFRRPRQQPTGEV